jgi:hypothetical protein
MSGLDLINTMQLQDVRADAKTSETIMELGQRAEYIKQATGVNPDSWYLYKKKNAEDLKLNPVRKAITSGLVGVGLGLAAAAVLVSFAPAGVVVGEMLVIGLQAGFVGGFLGAVVGAFGEVERENEANKKLVDGYSNYLSFVEQQAHTQQPAQQANLSYRNDHTEKLLDSRNQQVERTR